MSWGTVTVVLGVARCVFAFSLCGIVVACGSAHSDALFTGDELPGENAGGTGGRGSGSGGRGLLGGAPASGGRRSSGGFVGTGGVSSGSGATGSGGAGSGGGGVVGTGGIIASGGDGPGGNPGAGGTVGNGGAISGSGGALPTCNDGKKNQDETDVDCGGATCPKCVPGRVCFAATDCTTAVCRATLLGFGFCGAASCGDLVQNSTETDVDCGGVSCSPCANGKKCVAASDCTSASCVAGVCTCKPLTCAQITGGCGTNISDGCSGHLTCPACSSLCADGKKDGNETAVDCGGPECKPCGNNLPCALARDCQSSVCKGVTAAAALTCRPATCMDGVKNAAETDVDCGGAMCSACPKGRICKVAADCVDDVCASGICSCIALTCDDDPVGCGPFSDGCGTTLDCGSCLDLCIDGKVDGHETDIDCGGPDCPQCPTDSACRTPDDCVSGVCDSNGGSGLVCQ